MYNLKLCALTIFFVSGCVTVPTENPFTVLVRDDFSKNGDWKTLIYDDEFDGKEIQSIVFPVSGGGSYKIITDTNGIRNYINYSNGDGYICGTYSINAEHIFKKENGEEYRYDFPYSLSTSRDTLISMNPSAEDGKVIHSLNNYDEMIIRTTDTCGSTITRRFEIKGTTHIISKSKNGA
mgnify:FL=1|tara:strand:+ start:180 stop:716 length:537 start_codon:yes stop_codon:yes gene_type:complete